MRATPFGSPEEGRRALGKGNGNHGNNKNNSLNILNNRNNLDNVDNVDNVDHISKFSSPQLPKVLDIKDEFDIAVKDASSKNLPVKSPANNDLKLKMYGLFKLVKDGMLLESYYFNNSYFSITPGFHNMYFNTIIMY